jgi:Repeat of unknown function (DUF6923)
MLKSSVVAVVVLGALALPAHAQTSACKLFGNEASDEGKQFYRLNPTTGVGSVIGDPGQAVTGLAFHPVTGVLYGSTATTDIAGSTLDICHLITIDPLTGNGTDIGSFGLSDTSNEGCTLADLTFDPTTNILYGWRSRREGDLYTVNLQTGAATKVGESGLSGLEGGGLAFGPGGKLFLAAEGTEGKLRTINKATGLPIASVDLTGYGKSASIAALAYAGGGFLFGVTRKDGDLIRINATTGEIETIGPAANDDAAIDALAFQCAGISAPATSARTLVLLALGLMTFGTWHRSRRRRRGSRAAT